MGLKTTVKVGKISNLSDARYCAGMGVTLLGFVVTENADGYISPGAFKELRGWFTGPAVVAQIIGSVSENDLKAIIENYHPDYLEIGLHDFLTTASSLTIPAIVVVDETEITAAADLLKPYSDKVAFVQLSGNAAANKGSSLKDFKVMVSSFNNPEEVLSYASGIALEGSNEDRPGLKSYDSIAGVLEHLETED